MTRQTAPKADALPDCATPRRPDGPRGNGIFDLFGQPGSEPIRERQSTERSASGPAVPKKSRKMLPGRSRPVVDPTDPSPAGRKTRRLRRQAAQTTRAKEIPELLPSDRNRLNRMIERKGPGDCWPWLGAKSGFGYGRFKIDGRLFSPHRLIYADAHGPIENVQEHHGSVVMHTCDNPACCNPAHLRLGRQVANVADMIAKGRRGHTVPGAALSRLSGRA